MCIVVDCEYYVMRLDFFVVGEYYAGDLVILYVDIVNVGVKVNFVV